MLLEEGAPEVEELEPARHHYVPVCQGHVKIQTLG